MLRIVFSAQTDQETTMPDLGQLKRYIAQAIESSESSFACLVFVGSLRDAYTGRYIHEGWSGLGSETEIHATLRDVHCLVFEWVLRLSVIELGRELRRHFRSLGSPEPDAARLWLEIEPFRDLIPQGCSRALREFFISQVRNALEILRRAPEWPELAGPVASPRSQLAQSPLLRWIN